jgi:hypothetical protein
MKVLLEIVAVQALSLSTLHLPFEARLAVNTVMFAAYKGIPGFD